MTDKWKSRDYFAEMYVAGLLADAGWNVYFPHRDQGFDMIATFIGAGGMLIRPVQVKGKYPKDGKGDKARYGFDAKLTALHPEMVLALPLFADPDDPAPVHVAWMPLSEVRSTPDGGHRCEPARFASGRPVPRREFLRYFDGEGLRSAADADWSRSPTVATLSTGLADRQDSAGPVAEPDDGRTVLFEHRVGA